LTAWSQSINNKHLNIGDVTIEAGDLACLKAVALLGGCRGPVHVSAQSLARTLGTSPQTASRRLQSLEAALLVTRSVRPAGQYVSVSRVGEEVLHREYSDYCRLFGGSPGGFVLTGHVVSGVGEGRYYMALPPYREQFAAVLGADPYPGTLNVRLDGASVPVRKRLDALDWTAVHGFVAEARTFGDARALPCRIGDHRCAIVVPGRTHYPEDIVEVIAGVPLRETLGLADADRVTIEVPDERDDAE
jgi:riboflavin kinase